MAKRTKEPPIVAELGRPETPEETAARKAENSRLYRQRKTINNLIAALGVSLIAMLALVLIVPRDDREQLPDVDFHAVAAEAQPGFEEPLADPQVPEGWQSNQAEIRTSADGVTEWYIGFILVEDDSAQQYVGLSQGINANDTWVYEMVDRRPPTGTVIIDGVEWEEYDYSVLEEDEAGNKAYALVRRDGGSTYVLYGPHSPEIVQELAGLVL